MIKKISTSGINKRQVYSESNHFDHRKISSKKEACSFSSDGGGTQITTESYYRSHQLKRERNSII